MSGKEGEVKARVEGKGRGAKKRSQGLEMHQLQFEVKQSCQAAGQAGKIGKEL